MYKEVQIVLALLSLCIFCPGCGIVIGMAMVQTTCPVHATYDNFHNLQRASCATDAQWAQAQLDEKAGL